MSGLTGLTQQEFRKLVDLDVRGKAVPRDAALLRNGDLEVTERWYATLVYQKQNVESTLAAKREENKTERLELIAQAEALERGVTVGEHGRIVQHTPSIGDVARARELRAQADSLLRTYLKWRTGALRFRAGVEERLSEASWRRATSEKSVLLVRERELLGRIEAHRAAVAADGGPSAVDLALWGVVSAPHDDED